MSACTVHPSCQFSETARQSFYPCRTADDIYFKETASRVLHGIFFRLVWKGIVMESLRYPVSQLLLRANTILRHMRFPDFQPCLFIVSDNGEVLRHEPHFEEWLGNRAMAVQGEPFKTLLVTISPDWASIVPDRPSKLPQSLFLPWESPGESNPLFGLSLRRISYENTHFLSLSPELSRDWTPGTEDTNDDAEPSESLRGLALRATNAEIRLETYMANFPGIFFSQRPDLSFKYLGEGARDMLFQEPDPLYKNGGLFLNALSVEDRDRFVDTLRNNSRTPSRFSISYQVQDSDTSEVRYLLDVRTPQLTPSGMLIGYDGVWLDVTRQVIAENRLSDTVWKENLTYLTNDKL